MNSKEKEKNEKRMWCDLQMQARGAAALSVPLDLE